MVHLQVVLDEFGTDELHKPSHDDRKPPLFGFGGFIVDSTSFRDLVHDFVRFKQRTLSGLPLSDIITYKCDGTDIFIAHLTEAGVARHQKDKNRPKNGKSHLGVRDRHTLAQRIDCGSELIGLLEKYKAQIVYYAMTKNTKPVHNGTEHHINVYAATRLLRILNDNLTKERCTFSLLFDWHTQEEARKKKQTGKFIEIVRSNAALADMPVQANNRLSPSVQLADWVGGLCGRWLSFQVSPQTHAHMKVYDELFGSALRRVQHPCSTIT